MDGPTPTGSAPADLCADRLRQEALCAKPVGEPAKWFTLSGIWRITEDTAIGVADKVGSDISEHPWRAAGELVVGAAAVGATILAAPEVAAGAGALAAVVGVGEAGAEVVGGLAAAGWLTVPYVGITTSATKDTVAGLNNTQEDRQVLMHPEAYSPERVASADVNVRKNLGPPALQSLEIATGVFGTTFFGGSTIGSGLARTGELPKPTGETQTSSTDGRTVTGREAREGRVGASSSDVDVKNPAYDTAVQAAGAYVKTLRDRFASGRAQTPEEARAETTAKHDYIDAVYQLRDRYGYGLLSPEALEALQQTAGKRLIVDFGAGNGYAASLMQQRGMDVRAIDAAPVGKAANDYWYNPGKGTDPSQFRSWTDVEKGDVNALRDLPKDSVLFLSWPPADATSAAILRNYSGNTVVVLTETGGSTGTRSFWNALESDFNLQRRVPISPMQSAAGEPFVGAQDGYRFTFDMNDPSRQELLVYQRRTQTTTGASAAP